MCYWLLACYEFCGFVLLNVLVLSLFAYWCLRLGGGVAYILRFCCVALFCWVGCVCRLWFAGLRFVFGFAVVLVLALRWWVVCGFGLVT